jgi:transposase
MTRDQARALHAQGVSKRQIAERLGVSTMTVAAWLRRPPTFPARTCRLCGQAFTPTNGRQRFCTPEHQVEHQRRHGAPRTTAGWRERVRRLEAEIARARARLDEREAA